LVRTQPCPSEIPANRHLYGFAPTARVSAMRSLALGPAPPQSALAHGSWRILGPGPPEHVGPASVIRRVQCRARGRSQQSREKPLRGRPFRRHMLRATYGDLCCAQNYVAIRAEREDASGCLRADRGLCGRRRFQSWSRQRNIFSAGLTSRPSRCDPTTSRSTGLAFTSWPARNSSDACAIAVGRRISKPGRRRTCRAVRVAREPSPGRNYVALVSPDPPQRRPHSAEGNIVLRAT
jgi:hypothetical protein